MVKNPPANAGDVGSILGSGRSPGEVNGNPLQYSCLENPWTEEPGGLLSMESQRVGHDWATEQPIFRWSNLMGPQMENLGGVKQKVFFPSNAISSLGKTTLTHAKIQVCLLGLHGATQCSEESLPLAMGGGPSRERIPQACLSYAFLGQHLMPIHTNRPEGTLMKQESCQQ